MKPFHSLLSRTMAILLSLLLLTACTAEPKPTNTPNPTNTLMATTTPTSTDMHDTTNNLVIYKSPNDYGLVDTAVRLFKHKFPDVAVEVREFIEGTDRHQQFDTYLNVLISDLIAGKGPDVILLNGELDNIYKSMDAGILDNLDPYFAQDKDFHAEDFTTSIFNAGVYKGQRFFVPISYRVSAWLTTQESLAKADFTLPENPTFAELAAQIMQFCQRNTSNNNVWLLDRFPDSLYMLMASCGLKYMDYATGTVNIDTHEFKLVMETYKTMYKLVQTRAEWGVTQAQVYTNGDTEKMIMGGRVLFGMEWSSLFTLQSRYAGLLTTQTPVLLQFPNINGGKTVANVGYAAAIRSNSENKANAYAFLKILLSDVVQNDTNLYNLDVPVRTQSVLTKANRTSNFPLYYNIDSSVTYTPPSKEMVASYAQTLTDVTFVQNETIAARYVEAAMQPYFDGQKSYESCLAELQNKLELYIAE